MKKNKKKMPVKGDESILAQKTNEDFNTKFPTPNDFKQNKKLVTNTIVANPKKH